jgi:hypothetical protein
VQDRLIREVIFREKAERVAHVKAIAGIVARLLGMETEKAFGGLIQEYASEVYGETYNPELLQQKAQNLRAAQAEVRGRRERDQQLIGRLDRMGEYAQRKKKQKTSP